MNAAELLRYLHEHIPLSQAMQVAVVECSPARVVLGAPLAPNINHRDTAFGGSVSALAILSAWSLVHLRLLDAGLQTRLVIQRNQMQYDGAIDGTFTAAASAPEPAAWAAFVRLYQRKGLARVAVRSLVEQAGQVAARFEGEFVALSPLAATGGH